jgi:hypothetical protein
VAIGAKRDCRILAESPGHRNDIDAGGQQLGCDMVPQVVEPDVELHAVAQTVKPAGHIAGINGRCASHVGAKHKGVRYDAGSACQRSLDLALVVDAQQLECHQVDGYLADAPLRLCPLANNKTGPPDADDGCERDCHSHHVHR